jgi:hypothetical protein
MTIRSACPLDARALARLAALDSATPLTGPVLVAEVNGELIAALALHSGRAVADPFRPTVTALRQLRLRRYELLRRGGSGAWARPRFALAR